MTWNPFWSEHSFSSRKRASTKYLPVRWVGVECVLSRLLQKCKNQCNFASIVWNSDFCVSAKPNVVVEYNLKALNWVALASELHFSGGRWPERLEGQRMDFRQTRLDWEITAHFKRHPVCLKAGGKGVLWKRVCSCRSRHLSRASCTDCHRQFQVNIPKMISWNVRLFPFNTNGNISGILSSRPTLLATWGSVSATGTTPLTWTCPFKTTLSLFAWKKRSRKRARLRPKS